MYQSTVQKFSVERTYVYSFSLLQTSLQLFDEMSECHVAILSAIINRYMDKEQHMAFDLFNHIHRLHNTLGITCVLVKCHLDNIYDQIMDIIMEYITPEESNITRVSQTIDFTTCESIRMPHTVDKTGLRILAIVTKVVNYPEGLMEKVIVNDVNIGLGYIFVLVIKVLAAKQLLLFLTSIGPEKFFQISLAVVKIFKDMFVYVGMYNEDVGRQVSVHFDINRNNSKVFAFKSISLESINNLAAFVVTKIEGTPYELVKCDADATNNFVRREFYHCEFYKLNGTALGSILKESWLKALGEYKEVFDQRGKLVFGHNRETSMIFIIGINDVKSFKIFGAIVDCVSLALYKAFLNIIISFSYNVATKLMEDMHVPKKGILKYHEESFISMVTFKFENCSNVDNVLKDWLPKYGSRKLAANVDLVVAILHRKMIERGSVMFL